jgi:hypothetical protein
MYRLFLLPLLLLVAFVSSGQSAQSELYDEPTVIYRNQTHGGGILHTNGLGAFLYYGRYKGVKKVLLFGGEFVTMRHNKEIRSFNPVYEDSRSYVYGKVNNFYVLRPSFGVRRVITEKVRRSGVEIGYTWHAGPSLGITKPIYLEIGYPSIPYQWLAVERYDPDRHFFDSIYGRASALNGLNSLSLHPGAFFKFAFNFEYSDQKDRLRGLDAGFAIDAYPNRIPIMAEQLVDRNNRVFLTFFVNFFFGGKYNE